MDLDHFVASLSPPRSRAEVLSRASPVPSESGLYAWTFGEPPGQVPVSGCVEIAGRSLLYIGVAPSRVNSRRTLRDRLLTHYAGNAAGSTLRLTLGCLLGLPLVRKGSRLTFGTDGEQALSSWMGERAFVSWVVHPRPWEIESQLVAMHQPPLNIEGNGHAFTPRLREIRAAARARARMAELEHP
ncbi:MAG: hypothetical protein GEU80_09105 [Dehalococcoidia bacterium]|nr:hypothetical protein [Dehalococcoidia bacterium]